MIADRKRVATRVATPVERDSRTHTPISPVSGSWAEPPKRNVNIATREGARSGVVRSGERLVPSWLTGSFSFSRAGFFVGGGTQTFR